jgi:hypothetical protein
MNEANQTTGGAKASAGAAAGEKQYAAAPNLSMMTRVPRQRKCQQRTTGKYGEIT